MYLTIRSIYSNIDVEREVIVMAIQVLASAWGSFCSGSASIWQVIGYVVNIFKIVIPIIIVILAIMDLGKAVMAGKEDEIKTAQNMLIKRIIYGVAIFFVVTIVQVVFNLVGNNVISDPASEACWVCATNPTHGNCTKYIND